MIIDVPSAAIEPFEPHGIPRLNDIVAQTVQTVQLALKNVFAYLNSSSGSENGRMIIIGMRHIIIGRLLEAGADDVRVVIRGPYNDKGRIPYCGISVHYRIPGKKRRQHHAGGPIWSEGGFR